MYISLWLLGILLIGAFVAGAFIAWNNSKASLKSKLDAEIRQATSAGAAALSNFKSKL